MVTTQQRQNNYDNKRKEENARVDFTDRSKAVLLFVDIFC